MSTDRARQAPGQPTGGQFAATAGTDAGVDLAQPEPPLRRIDSPLSYEEVGRLFEGDQEWVTVEVSIDADEFFAAIRSGAAGGDEDENDALASCINRDFYPDSPSYKVTGVEGERLIVEFTNNVGGAESIFEDLCYQCGASLDDGEGSNGLCGNCADREDAARAEDEEWE